MEGDVVKIVTCNGAADSDDISDSEEEEDEDDNGGYELLPQHPSDDEDNGTINTPPIMSDVDDNCSNNPIGAVNNIEISDVDEVKNAMSGFVLPVSATPTWAQSVPEETWMKELLDGIRNNKDNKPNS